MHMLLPCLRKFVLNKRRPHSIPLHCMTGLKAVSSLHQTMLPRYSGRSARDKTCSERLIPRSACGFPLAKLSATTSSPPSDCPSLQHVATPATHHVLRATDSRCIRPVHCASYDSERGKYQQPVRTLSRTGTALRDPAE